ncbi:hypothetical protein, partial [Kitasatospora sp. DSM 101779]|uniref:hypothetical protein n=1 Tax=Kitasatospora sp. DSM 101779 TaxID=2853165 RepID=UPI0021DB5B7D
GGGAGGGGAGPPVVPPLDRETYYATRPRIRAEVEVLAADPAGRVVAVHAPVAADRETPRGAAARLLRERLGTVRPPGRLLALDWLPGDRPRLVYVFDGGRLDRHRPADGAAAAGDRRTTAALAHRGTASGPLELVDGVPVAGPW